MELWKRIKPCLFDPKMTPVALLGVCGLGFGLMISWLGFYQDDWYQLWFRRAFGPGVFIDYYAIERPFMAGIYMFTTWLVGLAPLNWQIFGLFCRWLAVLAVWWTFSMVWPGRIRQVTWIAILFAIYPGFRHQQISVIYSNYFLQMAVHILSIGLMIHAIRNPRRFWVLIPFSLLAGAFGIFTSEYFFGLELLRPVILWIVFSQIDAISEKERIKKMAMIWSPYLLIVISFLIWRLLIYRFPTYQPVFIASSPSAGMGILVQLVKTVLQDTLEMGLLAWFQPLIRYFGLKSASPALLASLLLAVLSGLATFFYLINLSPPPISKDMPERKFRSQSGICWIGLGVFILLTSGWQFWIVEIPVGTDFYGSRFGISFMLGSSVLMVGLIDHLARTERLKIATVALITALSMGYHFLDANVYRQAHMRQASFFQQLVWRIPSLKLGTLIVTSPLQEGLLSGDNSLTAALNWIYDQTPPFALDYMLFYLPDRLESKNLPGITPGLAFVKEFRTTAFYGNTSESVVVFFPYPHCLRVLDPEIDIKTPRPIDMPLIIKEAASISNLDQIIIDAQSQATLPDGLFNYRLGEESWCHYFQKADLARQKKDWQEIADLGDEAFQGNRKIDNTWELLPFIEGYALAGRFERARQLTLEADEIRPNGKQTPILLCYTWRRIGAQIMPAGAQKENIADLLARLECD